MGDKASTSRATDQRSQDRQLPGGKCRYRRALPCLTRHMTIRCEFHDSRCRPLLLTGGHWPWNGDRMLKRLYFRDFPVIEMNRQAGRRIGCNVYLVDGGNEYLIIDIGYLETAD